MTNKKTERSPAESLVRRLGFIAEQVAGELQNHCKQDWRRRQAGIADGIFSASAASLATITDLRPGSDGHLGVERDPRIADEEGVAVFLHRAFIRAFLSRQNRADSLPLHKAYVFGVQQPILLNENRELPSVLVVPADQPAALEENLQDSFHASPCSAVMTLVDDVVIDGLGDLPGNPHFNLRSVLGSVIVDLRPGLRQVDHVSGYDSCLVWRETDGGDPFRLLFNGEGSNATLTSFREPRQVDLLTGRNPVHSAYLNAVEDYRRSTINGKFSVHDQVSAIEIVRSLACGKSAAWLMQPDSVSTWILGALTASMWGLDGRVCFYDSGENGAMFWRNRGRRSPAKSDEISTRRAEKEGCCLITDHLDHETLVDSLSKT